MYYLYTFYIKFAMHSVETCVRSYCVQVIGKLEVVRTLDKKQHVDTRRFGRWPDIFRLETDIAGRVDYSLAILAAM